MDLFCVKGLRVERVSYEAYIVKQICDLGLYKHN